MNPGVVGVWAVGVWAGQPWALVWTLLGVAAVLTTVGIVVLLRR